MHLKILLNLTKKCEIKKYNNSGNDNEQYLYIL